MLDIARPIPQGNSIWAQTLQWFQTTFSISSSPSAVHLCHGMCSVLDKGPLEDTLKVFARFMEENPREVVTFIIENVGEFKAEEIGPSFVAAQLDRYAFVPSFAPKLEKAAYEWPTLAEMIERDQRLVVFIDNKADTERVPYILPEWEYMMEIPYANISPVSQFGCDQERPRDGVPRDLLVVNHFVYNRLTIGKTNIDSPLSAWQVEERGYNSLESLLKHVDTCKDTWGDRVPNYIVLDYYNIGNDSLFKVVDQINGF
ncbi:hypothetical protein LPJ66_006849 [Kickxella alabastrina]|uniref:Uncharacterized protein n=1 Tax=Kickxella alabastrina TaxID=61397 RepID=A0ACC1IIU2_9FUNG|nr:hypothetical protein LPJ66_006849 [Kickxella alabastrina]